jgi:hypothetical protein
MKKPARFVLTALGLALATSVVFGQTWKTHCTSIGPGGPEPLGDREGHGLVVASSVCTVEGGPLNGGITTQQVIWEGDKGTATLLSGDGVTRKPGTIAAYRNTGGTLTTVMKDGKPAGWTTSGTSVITMAVGEAASMKGKSVSWTGKATGPRTYVIDSKLD